jgi:hypothetical protein
MDLQVDTLIRLREAITYNGNTYLEFIPLERDVASIERMLAGYCVHFSTGRSIEVPWGMIKYVEKGVA